MAVGKGSMARAVRAAETASGDGKSGSVAAAGVISGGTAADQMCKEAPEQRTETADDAAKKPGKRSAGKKKKAAETGTAYPSEPGHPEEVKTSVVTEIVYASSYQVLDRKAAENECFQVGEAMPIYYY